MLRSRRGGGSADPNYNSRLATVITKAKAANMPNDNIKRVLEKAASAGSGDAYDAITYEGLRRRRHCRDRRNDDG